MLVKGAPVGMVLIEVNPEYTSLSTRHINDDDDADNKLA